MVQIAGCDPYAMAEAARLAQDSGAAMIDINMGCPAKRVTNGYAGSHLMRDMGLRDRAYSRHDRGRAHPRHAENAAWLG